MIVQAPVPPLEKAWDFQADSSIREPGLVAAGDMIFFGSKEGLIYALDAMSGLARWTFRTGNALKLPLVAADGIIFAASKDKNFYAIDAQTGEKRWQFSAGKDFVEWTYWGPVFYGPVVADGIVYIATKDKKLYALDAQTGKERWRFSAGGEISPPAVGYGPVFFGSKDKRVYALDVNSGEKLWEAKTGHKKHSCPIIADGKVLIAGDDDLYALNPNNGTILWKVKKVLHYQKLPAVVGGLAFCTKDLAVIDLACGKEVEKISSLNDFSRVVVADEILYAMAPAKQTSPVHIADFLFAYDVATREEKWQACFNTLIRFCEISEGFIFLVDTLNNKLIALNTSKFTKRWESDKLPRGFLEDIGKPVVAYGMVFVSSGKTVHAFRSSKDPAAQRFLEISDEISPSPKYKAETLREEVIWPNCCCLCCGPAEESVELTAESRRYRVKVTNIPYCTECRKKVTKIIGREKPGVEIIRLPPTCTFRNERYWAMFMEANRLR